MKTTERNFKNKSVSIVTSIIQFPEPIASWLLSVNVFSSYHANTMLLSLYKTIVCPIVEYGNVIWGPHFALDQQSLEKIQRRATKLIPTLQHVPYTDRLALLKLSSLRYRRRRGDMILMYRIIQGFIGIDLSIFTFRSRDIFPTTRGHQYKVFKYPVY